MAWPTDEFGRLCVVDLPVVESLVVERLGLALGVAVELSDGPADFEPALF